RVPIATLPVWAFREKRPVFSVVSFPFFWFFRIISIRAHSSETFCRLAIEAPPPPCLDRRACQGYAAIGVIELCCCLAGREGEPHARDCPRRSPCVYRRGVHR